MSGPPVPVQPGRGAVLGCDLLVYGATAAGVCAAVAAADHGLDVALVGPQVHVGGMTSGGLGWTDLGDARVVGGLAARFHREVAEHYGVAVGTVAGPEPHVAEAILERWLDTAGVRRHHGVSLVDVAVTDARITEIGLRGAAGDLTVRPALVVDASYEGDLMAAVGVDHRVGREDADLHGESLAGRQEVMPGRHAMPWGISPFRDDPTGREAGPVLPGIRDEPLAPVGTGDGGVMSYGFRVCLSPAPDRIPFAPRSGYDPAALELGRRLLHHHRSIGFDPPAGWWLGLTPNLPGGKADGNSLGPFSLSLLDGSAWHYPEASPDRRAAIWQRHRDHALDLLWFLASDPEVPARVRRELGRWGLPSDEFTDTGHLPHQLYVREARRLQGEVVLTQHHLTRPHPWPDPVAMGSYHIDIREVQRTWRWAPEHPDPVAFVVNEGYLSVAVPPYPIPYRALLPRREQCRTLLVPVCVSASAVAFASIRMEPQYQMLGQAAGTAAALALRTGRDLHDLDTDLLTATLRDAGQVLALP